MSTRSDNSVKAFIKRWSNDLGRRGGPEKKSRLVAGAAICCDPALLTCLHLVTWAPSEMGASAEIISSLCQKATRRIGYLRKGISPLCKLWIKHCNTRGCHTLVPLTFLYLTVKNSFSHLFSALVSAITMFQSRLVPTVTHNTQKDRSLSSCAAITSPISLKQKSLV